MRHWFGICRTKAQVVTRLFIGKRYFYFCITSTLYFSFTHIDIALSCYCAPSPQPPLSLPPPPSDSTSCCKNATYVCANKIKTVYTQSLIQARVTYSPWDSRNWNLAWHVGEWDGIRKLFCNRCKSAKLSIKAQKFNFSISTY